MISNKNTLTQALHSAVTESLENMFFSEVNDVEFHWGSVEVTEPISGKITVAFPKELVYEIVHEVFGVERNEITITVINDIIAEVANTVAGRLVNELVKGDKAFKLQVPKTGMGTIDVAQPVSFINHYEMNNKIYLVMLEGESLLEFQDIPISDPLEQVDDDTWG